MNENPIPSVNKQKELSGFVRALSEPLSKYGWPVWLVYVIAVIGFVYLLNPTSGFIEFLPDNLPIVGNLDESVAVMLVLSGIVEALEGKKYRQGKDEQEQGSESQAMEAPQTKED